MQLITHRSHLDALPESPLRNHIAARFNQFTEDPDDIPPVFLLVELDDDITGPNYAFIGNCGLLSDLYEQAAPGEAAFTRPYEWVSHCPDLKLHELLFLQHSEDAYWILIPSEIADAHPYLKWVLTDESLGGLAKPQPMY